jgi:hypothetical protein
MQMFKVLADIFVILCGLQCAIFAGTGRRERIESQDAVFGLHIRRAATLIRWGYLIVGILFVTGGWIDLVFVLS